jgi:hypothetical protein
MIVNLFTIYRNFLRWLMRHQLVLVLVPVAVLLTIGTIGYSLLEGWSLLDALYATTAAHRREDRTLALQPTPAPPRCT